MVHTFAILTVEKLQLQGDSKLVPPLPGQNEMCTLKTDNGTFKYNLFKNYLENFVLWNPLHKMPEQFSQKQYYMGYIEILPIRPYLPYQFCITVR